MNKKQRITSIAMAALLTASTFSSTAFALDKEVAEEDISVSTAVYPPSNETTSDNSDVAMKTALTKVKQRISIPSDLTEFSYSSNTYQNVTSYYFNWNTLAGTDDNSTYKSINVTIIGDIITNYSYYDNSNDKTWNVPKLAKLSDDELLKKAKAEFKKINPELAGRSVVTSEGTSLFGNTARFTFKRMVNGVPVGNNGGSIEVHKNTGKIISFYSSWWDNATFKSKDGILSNAKAIDAYKSLNTLTPFYKISTDWETGKKSVNIVYEPSFTKDIDAHTGKLSSMYDDQAKINGKIYDGGYGDEIEVVEECADVDTSPASGMAKTFTPAEIKAIKTNEKLITKDKANEIIKKDKYIGLNDNYKINSSNLYEEINNYDNTSTFYWNISYNSNKDNKVNNLHVKINAETGRIISYENYSYFTKTSAEVKAPKLDVSKASKIADEAIKYYLPEICSKYKASPNNNEEVKTWGTNNKNYESSRTFAYCRYVNGIEVSGDNIYVNVNSDGEVMSFSYRYTDDVKFPSSTIISADKAYEKLFAQQPIELKYNGFKSNDGKAYTYLVYNMGYYSINAKTGKLCNSDGTEIVSQNSTVTYSDIKGIAAEKAINEFKRHGVMLDSIDGKFEPNKAITEQEFSSLVDTIFNTYQAYPAYFKENSKNGKLVIDKKLTNANACKYLVKAWNADEYAQLKGIYTTPFSDVSATRSDIGYIAICYGKGAISQTSGKFNPDGTMTRANAMKMLYEYVLKG